MALFDVPGWSIPNEPVAVTSKKRKRASKQNLDKVQSAATNVERLMEQLAASPAAENTRHELKEGKSGGMSADGDRPPEKNAGVSGERIPNNLQLLLPYKKMRQKKILERRERRTSEKKSQERKPQ
jgi:hypothetical protein